MKRNLITAKENAANIVYNSTALTIQNTVFREKSLVDEFYVEENNGVISIHDPIYMLFNQQRLSSLGSAAVDMWLESMKRASDVNNPLNELRKKCSDEDLLTMIKSRHLQKPSEIMAWAQYMKANMDEFTDNVRNLVAEKEKEQVAVAEQTTGETPASIVKE